MVSTFGSGHSTAPDPPAGWDMHMVGRTGAPPLRFQGRLLHHDRVKRGQSEIFVSLWQKRRDGVVLAYALPDLMPAGSTAVSLGSIDEAVRTMEEVCAKLRTETGTHTPPGDAGLEAALVALFDHQRRKDQAQDFLNLAGLALAQWDAWCGADVLETSD